MRGYRRLKTTIVTQIGAVLFLAVAVSLTYTVLLPGKSTVHANTVTNPNTGGTVTATVTGITSDTGDLCGSAGSDVNGTQHVDFAATLSNADIKVGTNDSTLSYDLTLKYKGCGENVAAYAIYSPEFCEPTGFYGAGGPPGDAYDCLKYIGNQKTDANYMKYLGCIPGPGGTQGGVSQYGGGRVCVTQYFHDIQVTDPSPGNAANYDFRDYTQSIKKVTSSTTSSGSATYNGTLCEYYQYPSGTDYTEGTHPQAVRCRNLSISYKWTYTPPKGPPPASGGASATCNISLSPSGYTEVNKSGFSATFSTPTTYPKGSTTGTAPKGPGTITTYSTVNPKIVANSDAPPSPQTSNSSSATFSYGAQSVPKAYGVNGTYTWTLRKTVTTYKNVQVTTKVNGKDVTKTVLQATSVNTDTAQPTVTCPPVYKYYVVKPYMQVYGGDVISGTYPTSSGTCNNGGAGTITGWNKGASTYAGAGTQFAAIASGTIHNFVSGMGLATAPKPLAFANNSGGSYGYGGGYGPVPLCNFSGLLSGATTLGTTTWNSMPASGVYHINGNLLITGPITYNWTGVSSHPHLSVLVSGNIYILGNVSEIDGLYAASGTIDTCASQSAATYYTNCQTPLKVYGSLVANNITFHRTTGTINGNPGGVAEQINYSPQEWLPSYTGELNTTYDSITGLPPVL